MKKRMILGWMLVAGMVPALAAEKIWLEDVDRSAMTCGYRTPLVARSVEGGLLSLGGKTYEHGLGTHAPSLLVVPLGGNALAFEATVGLDDEIKDRRQASVEFKVWADGRLAATSGRLARRTRTAQLKVDLAGVQVVALEVTDGGDGNDSDHADWADAFFLFKDGTKPPAPATLTEQLGILTPKTPAAPRVNGPGRVGVRPGSPILYRVPVTGERPMEIAVAGLPPGAVFNADRASVNGAVARPGEYPLVVTARNAHGRATRTVTLVVGDTLALTPPMGWNSWNVFGGGVTEEKVKAAADAMVASGLADHGWCYVNIDDFWQNRPGEQADKTLMGPARAADGTINPNARFPSMKGLADYIHAKGLRAGLYSSPGPTTCGGCAGSWMHEFQDAKTYADWGFDYLKYDWCSYGEIFQKETGWNTWEWMGGGRMGHNPKNKPVPPREAWAKPYRLMQKCLRAQNRDIVYAYCQYGCGETEKWGREAGANVWRTWQDMKDTWTWMRIAMEGYVKDAEYYKYTGPGFWADPDMMIVGLQRSFGTTHPTYLTRNEQYAHVSMWCLLASPLLIGTDLTRLDAFTKSLLVNDELIAINQDTLGRQARRVVKRDAVEVWVRPLANGDYAVGVLNLYPLSRKTTLYFSWLDLDGEWKLRDCWSQRDLGRFSCCYTTEIPAHAALVLRLSR